MTKNRPWYMNEKEKLSRLHDAGATFEECGIELGRSADACRAMYNHERTREAAKFSENKYANAEAMWNIALMGRRFDDTGLMVKSYTTGKTPVYSSYRSYSLTGNAAQMCAK